MEVADSQAATSNTSETLTHILAKFQERIHV